VKVIRRSDESRPLRDSRLAFPRQLYFFYEKNTGASHFHVEAGADGRFPVDQAAGLLAMHCFVRGQSPADYVVMIEADTDILEGLNEKAEKLLTAGHSVTGSVKLTRREEEVLGGVMRSLANKEIASDLNLSERTVKFHVSSLLAKFGVRSRMELAREASQKAFPSAPVPLAVGKQDLRNFTLPPQGYRVAPRRASVVALAKPQMMA
jgi:DNA-binding CsgD family transcriptional regulator